MGKRSVVLLLVFSFLLISSLNVISAVDFGWCGNAHLGGFDSEQAVRSAGPCVAGNTLKNNQIDLIGAIWQWTCVGDTGSEESCWAYYQQISVGKIIVPTEITLNGDGSSSNPYQITNCQELQQIHVDLNANYKLMNDIDCSYSLSGGPGINPYDWVPIGNTTGSAEFNGVFEGNGKKIKNLLIITHELPERYNVGIFAKIGTSGVVRNLGLVDVYVLAKESRDATGEVSGGQRVGGLVGYNKGTIERTFIEYKGDYNPGYPYNSIPLFYGEVGCPCLTQGISGIKYVGGLVGFNEGIIRNVYSKNVRIMGKEYIGGIAGANHGTNAEIINSYSTSNLELIYSDSSGDTGYFGGIVGINGYNEFGELANNAGDVKNSFATGKVGCWSYNYNCIGSANGDPFMGGLIGKTELSGTIENNFWYDYPTTERCVSLGLCGDREDVAVACIRSGRAAQDTYCRTTNLVDYFKGVNVPTKSPFINNWDFTNVWEAVANDFPKLKWEEGGIIPSTPDTPEEMYWSAGNVKITNANIGKNVNATIKGLPSGLSVQYQIRRDAALGDDVAKEGTLTSSGSGFDRILWKAGEDSVKGIIDSIGLETGTYHFRIKINTQNWLSTKSGENFQSAFGELIVSEGNIISGCDSNDECWLENTHCTSSCVCETGYSPDGNGGCQSSSGGECGNGIQDSGEECDLGEHCTSSCTCEEGYVDEMNSNGCVQEIIDGTPITCNQDVNGETFETLRDVPSNLCSDGSSPPLIPISGTLEYQWQCGDQMCSLFAEGDPIETDEYRAESDNGCQMGRDFETVIYYNKQTNQEVSQHKLYCPAALPFFTIRNVIAVVIAVALIYIILALRNQNKSKGKNKKSSKKKR